MAQNGTDQVIQDAPAEASDLGEIRDEARLPGALNESGEGGEGAQMERNASDLPAEHLDDANGTGDPATDQGSPARPFSAGARSDGGKSARSWVEDAEEVDETKRRPSQLTEVENFGGNDSDSSGTGLPPSPPADSDEETDDDDDWMLPSTMEEAAQRREAALAAAQGLAATQSLNEDDEIAQKLSEMKSREDELRAKIAAKKKKKREEREEHQIQPAHDDQPAPLQPQAPPPRVKPTFSYVNRDEEAVAIARMTEKQKVAYQVTKRKWPELREGFLSYFRTAYRRWQQLRKERRNRLLEMLWYLLFVTVVSVALLYSRPTEHGAHVALVLEKYFSHDGLEEVKQASDILGFVNSSLLFGFPIATYEGGLVSAEAGALYELSGANAQLGPIMGNNWVIGEVQLRQWRVVERRCRVIPPLEESDRTCYPNYNPSEHEIRTNPPPSSWPLDPDGNVPLSSYWRPQEHPTPFQSLLNREYDAGAYTATLPPDRDDAVVQVQTLQLANWIDDNRTRAVRVEFSLYNPNVNIFVASQIQWEVSQSGGITAKARLWPADLCASCSSESSRAFAVHMFLFALVAAYALLQIAHWRKEGWGYLQDGYNWVTIINILIFLIVMGYKAAIQTSFNTHLGEDADPAQLTTQVHRSCYLVSQFYYWNAFNAVLVWARICKYLNALTSSLARDGLMLRYGIEDVFMVMLSYGVIFGGFALSFHMHLGQSMSVFQTMTSSSFTLWSMAIGSGPYASDIRPHSQIVGPLIYVAYMIFMIWVVSWVITAVLLHRHEMVKQLRLWQMDELSTTLRKVIRKMLMQVLMFVSFPFRRACAPCHTAIAAKIRDKMEENRRKRRNKRLIKERKKRKLMDRVKKKKQPTMGVVFQRRRRVRKAPKPQREGIMSEDELHFVYLLEKETLKKMGVHSEPRFLNIVFFNFNPNRTIQIDKSAGTSAEQEMVTFQRVQLEAVATLLDRVEEETDALARSVFRQYGTKMSEVGVRVAAEEEEEGQDLQVDQWMGKDEGAMGESHDAAGATETEVQSWRNQQSLGQTAFPATNGADLSRAVSGSDKTFDKAVSSTVVLGIPEDDNEAEAGAGPAKIEVEPLAPLAPASLQPAEETPAADSGQERVEPWPAAADVSPDQPVQDQAPVGGEEAKAAADAMEVEGGEEEDSEDDAVAVPPPPADEEEEGEGGGGGASAEAPGRILSAPPQDRPDGMAA